MSESGQDSYESERLLHQYLLFHYGSPEEIIEGAYLPGGSELEGLQFPAATVWSALMFELIDEETEGELRALDVGCAVGRSSFELSRLCSEVIGVDYSHAFVDAAEKLRQGRELNILRYHEGHLGSELAVRAPENTRPESVSFEVGDAMELREDLGEFDILHAANLLCRLRQPSRFLERASALVKPGGQLILATPCSWMEEYTPEENQPEGTTLEFLHGHLDDGFELRREVELPFMIRDHSRKFQWSTSQTTVWLRRETG